MVIVYTAILGGSDSLKPAPVGADRCVCFADHMVLRGDGSIDAKGWDIVQTKWSDSRRKAWSLRCVPHLQCGLRGYGYDTIIWVDASFTVTDLPRLLRDSAGHDMSGLRHHTRKSCYNEGVAVILNGQSEPADVKRQMDGYLREGFNPSALTISCILVRQNNPRVTSFNELWDSEIRTHPGDNTQLSLDYCAWKTGIGVHHLQGVRKDNPYAVHDHADHKRRRKPYR